MAITRAQIPEQIDLFDEGGEVLSSLSPEDIIALYGAQTSAPITGQTYKHRQQKCLVCFHNKENKIFLIWHLRLVQV